MNQNIYDSNGCTVHDMYDSKYSDSQIYRHARYITIIHPDLEICRFTYPYDGKCKDSQIHWFTISVWLKLLGFAESQIHNYVHHSTKNLLKYLALASYNW